MKTDGPGQRQPRWEQSTACRWGRGGLRPHTPPQSGVWGVTRMDTSLHPLHRLRGQRFYLISPVSQEMGPFQGIRGLGSPLGQEPLGFRTPCARGSGGRLAGPRASCWCGFLDAASWSCLWAAKVRPAFQPVCSASGGCRPLAAGETMVTRVPRGEPCALGGRRPHTLLTSSCYHPSSQAGKLRPGGGACGIQHRHAGPGRRGPTRVSRRFSQPPGAQRKRSEQMQ